MPELVLTLAGLVTPRKIDSDSVDSVVVLVDQSSAEVDRFPEYIKWSGINVHIIL